MPDRKTMGAWAVTALLLAAAAGAQDRDAGTEDPQREPLPDTKAPAAEYLKANPPIANAIGMKLVPIKAGTFAMGSTAGDKDEQPVHNVTLSSDFWIGQHEVTQAEYKTVTDASPSHFSGDTLPVEKVSWEDAKAFCEKLTTREKEVGKLPEGFVYRLPTEAEWEYCCRAGTTTEYAGEIDALGWVVWNAAQTTHPVGQKAPNPWGIHDMHGNVWEWCEDACSWKSGFGVVTDTYVDGVTDPIATKGFSRIRRGGSWRTVGDQARSANRHKYYRSHKANYVGFRVVLARPLK